MNVKRSVRVAILCGIIASCLLSGCFWGYGEPVIDCNGFNLWVEQADPSRNNSGDGSEIMGVIAVDGQGNVLYDNPNFRSAPVGTMLYDFRVAFSWQRRPVVNPITVTFYNPAGNGYGYSSRETFVGACVTSDPNVGDGRINGYDHAAPVAVFPVDFATGRGLHIYAIDAAGKGTLALIVHPEDVIAVPEVPEENMLIASTEDGAIAMYRLFTGEFQINVGDYVIVFDALGVGTHLYHP